MAETTVTESSTSSTSAGAPPSTPPPSPPRRRRWLRWLLGSTAALLLALFTLLGTAWWWMGQSDSLANTLERVAGWLPEGQRLEARDVQGTLRHGGRIGWLRWASPTMQVELEQANIEWMLRPLLAGEVRLGQVHIASLRIRSTPDPTDTTPLQPLESLKLPLRIDLPFQVDQLVWQGTPEVEASTLQGHYRYTGGHHQLAINQLQWAQGRYAAQLKLQGAAPMALEANLRGAVETALPGQDMQLHTLATVHINGNLAGADARLQVQAQAYAKDLVQSEHATALEQPSVQDTEDIADSQTLRAQVKATVRPWQPQPLEAAQAQLSQVDVSMFWPAGPHTLLSGEVQAGPEDGGWKLRADLRNAIPGPWDLQSLPVHQVEADVRQDGKQWIVEEAQINLGTGHLSVQGNYDSESQAVQGAVMLHQVSPAALWSTLDPTPLKGQLTAQTNAKADTKATADSSDPAQVQFTLDLATTRGPATGRVVRTAQTASALRIDSVRAQGNWKAPLLSLHDVQIQALKAQLDSKALSFNTDTLALQTPGIKAQLPGVELALNGHISPDDGAGQASLQLGSAPQLLAWLQQLPGMGSSLKGAQLQGAAQAQLQWKGGWGKLQQRLQNPVAPLAASGLRLTAQLRSDGLSWTPADQSGTTRIKQLSLELQGSPEQMQASLRSQLQLGAQSLAVDTQLQAGLLTQRGAAALDWQARVERLQAQWSPTGADANTWKAELAAPFTISQRTSGQTVRSQRIDSSAGELLVSAPTGNAPAGVQWQPTVLRQSGNGSWQLQSEGKLQGIPLAWADAFSADPKKGPLATAGISGDLSLQGHWNIDTMARTPVADVVLERAGGDIRLAVVEEESQASVTVVRSQGVVTRRADGSVRQERVPGRGLRARIRNLRVQLQTQGQEVHAQLLWDTERAGQFSADLRTRLQHKAEGWSWPENAPLNGSAKADLPNIGIWAMFAPPGWRVAGSLHADMRISGARNAPHWDGNLGADQLSIVSLLDGLDLHDGRLRARLQGTRLDITELSLQGGKGSSARILGYSGNLTPAPQEGGQLTGSGFIAWDPQAPAGQSGMRMDLQLKAEKLQVLVRADRQLSTSGGMQAKLEQGQFVLRGDLTVDRAAILLPDESAPALDKDVVVRSAASRKLEAERRAAEAKQQAKLEQAEKGATPTTARVPDILLKLDLGQDFALQGFGITTRLKGQLQVRGGNSLTAPPQITGEIHTEQGRYRAWGQSLDVETGLIRFNGPYDNPSLDITAIRPNITVRAGVRVTGSASAPRITLFSDPEMSDAEKLSWIVMGRDTTNGGAEAALLQQAALALLSGGGNSENFAGRVGLDEIGFKGSADPNDANSGAALTVGKRLSKDLYVTYEQSLNGAMGTLYVFYDLSRRLTLRAQTGVQTAMDLIYTMRRD
ncbi:MAG: translocation/assembly module TamB domain-containing protein [Acidovorax sp.]|nr:translocation/assembly module TamB domain-containing protein [Acidovorax sp.]